MEKTLLIGVDIGTQGTKAALYDTSGGLIAESFEASELIHPEPGATIQDADEMAASVRRTIREIMDKTGANRSAVACIGVCAQMSGILGVGRDGTAVTPYDSWLDTRCDKYISRMNAEAGAEIPRITGGQATCAHGAKELWWKNEYPENYKKVYAFVTPSAYAVMRLCGLDGDGAYIDSTHLHFTGFADTRRECWHDGLLNTFGMDAEKLPEIVKPHKTVGALSAQAADECGLTAGIPVAAGCGDSAASAYGAGINRAGLVYDVAGTASIFSYSTESFTPDTEQRTVMFTRSVVDGLWNAMAYISGGGMCLHWYRGMTGGGYAELDRLAEEVPAGCGGLLFIPHFAGRTCPGVPSVRGGWRGLEWEHGRAHMYRSIMESIAYEYAMYMSVLRASDPGISPDRIIGAGGGSKSRIFNKIKADVLGIPYCALTGGDTGAFGAAMLAGYSCGAKESLVGAVERGALSEAVMPDPGLTEVYNAAAARYRAALENMTVIYKGGAI